MRTLKINTILFATILAIASCGTPNKNSTDKKILKISCTETEVVKNVVNILNTRLDDRGYSPFEIGNSQNNNCLTLEIDIDSTLAKESFIINIKDPLHLKITGGDEKGLLYGVGKMLRTANYSAKEFQFGKWQGKSVPAKSFRGVYFATHLYNFYHISPIDVLQRYIEDLALMGYNKFVVFLDKHHYNGTDDKEYIEHAAKLHKMYELGISVGMAPVIIDLTNTGFANTPEHLKAKFPGRSFYGCEVCPSTQEGMDLILANHKSGLDIFKDLGEIYYSLWSYDQGGCACPKCFPWGSNGMYKTAKKVTEMVKKELPNTKIIYCTWLFDYKGEKEWEGLYDNMKKEATPWFDYILADSHEEYPEYPLTHENPAGVSFINFPEISMYGSFPWGGFGANPLPQRFSKLWTKSSTISDGGFLYSEGNFEDFNKAIYAGFYWTGNSETSAMINEYFNYEFGFNEFNKINELLTILESNHSVRWYFHPNDYKMKEHSLLPLKNKPGVYRNPYNLNKTESAVKLVDGINDSLPEWAKRTWRWRIIYIRTYLDHYLSQNNGEPDEKAEKLLEELAAIYGVDKIGSENPYIYMDRVNPFTNKFLKEQEQRLNTINNDKQILKNF